ncbi:MAG: hypothetical protein FWE80_10235 [Oscillospiraceae bacterium]|nr:hypothetical protein [Oscillospiraceae bacterium]
MDIKKIIKPYWPLLLFPVLCIPYTILNQNVIVNWLGCGCPRIDEQGNIVKHFNANNFTALFWDAVALTAVILFLYNIKKLPIKWYYKVLQLLLVIIASVFIMMKFNASMQWN